MSVDLLAAKEKYIVGEGSFGKVYKYTYNNESYAIKKVSLNVCRFLRIQKIIQN